MRESVDLIEVMGFQFYLATVLAAGIFFIAVFNLRFLNSLGDSVSPFDGPYPKCLVSILVPARNEEKNIRECLHGLISQNHQATEILVLDDWSTDNTANVVQEFVEYDSRVRMIKGAELPDGWSGKNWASYQLSQEAAGEFLLFIDADTILSSKTVSVALMHAANKAVDLLTIMPKRTAGCVTEHIIFPFIDWVTFCWVPMKIAHVSNNSHISATFGPFMLFSRAAYEAIGGYAAVRGNTLDDFELGRTIKRRGLRWMLFVGVNWVRILPYKGNIDAFKGVSRSIFPALYYRVSLFVLLLTVVLGLGLLPLFTLAIGVISYPEEKDNLFVSLALIGLVAIPWFIVCKKFQHSLLIVSLYPLSIVLMAVVAFHSLFTYSFGSTHWKGRKVIGQKARF